MKIKITKNWKDKEKKENNFFKNCLKFEYSNWLKANIVFSFICLIWFFSILMMPVNYQINGNLTPIYDVFGNYFSLTPLAIITIILFIFYIFHTIGMIVIFIKNKDEFLQKENANKKLRISIGFGWGFLFLLTFVFFVLIYIHPNTSLLILKQNFEVFLFYLNRFVSNKQQITDQKMLDYFNSTLVNDFSILKEIPNYSQFGSDLVVNEAVLNKLSDVPLTIYNADNLYYTPVTNVTFNTAIFTSSAGWYLIIIFFSFCLFYYFFLLISMYFVKLAAKNKNIFDFKQKKEFIKALFAEAKKAKQAKKESKRKNKELINEKEELLNNLNEVQLPPENELGEIATPIELSEVEDFTLTEPVITQEQLLEKIEENNRIKAKIKEIDDQRQKIKKEQSFFFRRKNKDKNNPEKINKRSTRIKKQEIAIPDKELEDIFKNLDIE